MKKLEKELLSKIDNILIEYQLNNDLIPTFAQKPQENTNNINQINLNKKPLNIEEQKIEKTDKEKQALRPPSCNLQSYGYYTSSSWRYVISDSGYAGRQKA